MSSIRVRLLKWLVGPILIVNIAAAGLTYLLAWTPAQLAFDQGPADDAAAARAHEHGAGTLKKRHEVQAATLRSLVLLEGVVTLALVGLAWLSVTNGLLPLARMRADLNGREAGDLAPIAQGDVPYELEPVVSAFNDLLARVQDGAKAQQDFLADMAHQLRTPLAGLKLQLEWLEARYAADKDTADSLQLMRLANDRMIRQTNQLLALARSAPASQGKAHFAPLDLAALVQESVQTFVAQADRKGQDIGFDLAPSPVLGEAFHLRDLIDNVVDNALRYTPAGGAVTVRCRREGGDSVFAVEDSGPGIAPEKRALVFNRFVRLDEKTAGSGLGLAIVRDIAAAHKARIELSSMENGPGLRFEVRFPARMQD
jgi:two-component system sensor histidine kinase TctE